jgi:hypothetical protein
MCSLFLLLLYMWYISNVQGFPFFSVYVLSYVCPVLSIWFEYPELLLLFQISCICPLYLV